MIGPSIVINGKISGDEDLTIEGTVEGSIDLPNQDVVIGQSGRIKADVQGKIVHIEGKIEGDIKGVEQVIISNSGNVRGNLVAPRVTLEDGAVFKGSIDMDPGEPLLGKNKVCYKRQDPKGIGRKIGYFMKIYCRLVGEKIFLIFMESSHPTRLMDWVFEPSRKAVKLTCCILANLFQRQSTPLQTIAAKFMWRMRTQNSHFY